MYWTRSDLSIDMEMKCIFGLNRKIHNFNQKILNHSRVKKKLVRNFTWIWCIHSEYACIHACM